MGPERSSHRWHRSVIDVIKRCHLLSIGLVLGLTGAAQANVPAAFFACEGAPEGEPCSMPGPFFGNCVRDTLCEDNPDTEVDECLLCVDPCWAALEEGSFCVRFDGADGVCQVQREMCTTDPEKSFAQCNRCVEGDIARTAPEDGCAAVAPGAAAGGAWMLILLLGAVQWRRSRPR